MALNDRERSLLKLIELDPFITQQDMAQKLYISRSTVANIIANLVNKGYLLGRAYIVNEARPIVCIGAANIDNRYIVQEELTENTSNNVRAASTLGGGARNVAENLGRLGEAVELISVAGDDNNWRTIKESSQHFMDLSGVTVLEDANTGNFIEIISKDEELLMGLSDVDIFKRLTVDRINQCLTTIQRAKCVVVDLNCPKETIEFLHAFTIRNNIPFYLLTVSIQQMKNMPDKLDGISVITKYNESEAKYHLPVQTDEELKEMVRIYLNKGVKEVMLSKDNQTIVYGNQEDVQVIKNPKQNQHHYHWGLNEAFCGAMIHSKCNPEFYSDAVVSGVVNAFETGESTKIVRTNLTSDKLKQDIENSPVRTNRAQFVE